MRVDSPVINRRDACKRLCGALTLPWIAAQTTSCYRSYTPFPSNAELEADFTIGADASALLIGDTQERNWLEGLLAREETKAPREQLLAALRKDPSDFIIHLGDIVFQGSSDRDWAKVAVELDFDSRPIFPVLGNHEYWGEISKARHQWQDNFPWLKRRRFYELLWGETIVLMLDTNIRALDGDAYAQLNWYKQRIDAAENSPKIRRIIVCGHHPPLTRSEIVSGDQWLQEHYLPHFFQSKKCRLWLAGHAHGFEHYSRQDKHFVVSAGGGGPRSVAQSSETLPPQYVEECTLPWPRPFHFARIKQNSEAVDIVFLQLNPKSHVLEPFHRLHLA